MRLPGIATCAKLLRHARSTRSRSSTSSGSDEPSAALAEIRRLSSIEVCGSRLTRVAILDGVMVQSA